MCVMQKSVYGYSFICQLLPNSCKILSDIGILFCKNILSFVEDFSTYLLPLVAIEFNDSNTSHIPNTMMLTSKFYAKSYHIPNPVFNLY